MTDALIALAQVVLIDITLAGDNAVVVGMAVAGLPAREHARAIAIGVAAAALIRVALSLVAVRLLAVIGLTLAGGLLLAWVCWKMFRELRAPRSEPEGGNVPQKTLRQAIVQIALADVSMSLDNVLAVAGAAKGHTWVLVGGLALSVVLMGVAASLLARLLQRHRWIAWVGLAVVAFVAVRMIWEGSSQVAGAMGI
ncbi:MAG: YjbE family putative metal transport protein [Rhodospirillales bacterium]